MMALKERRMKVTMSDFEEAKKKTLFRKKSKEPEGLYLLCVCSTSDLSLWFTLFLAPPFLFLRLQLFVRSDSCCVSV